MPSRKTFARAALAAALGVTAIAAAAQTLPRFAARTNLVVVSALAVDGSGRPVHDLRREEFRVFDEGRPQRIVHFTASSDMRARMLLLVDASGSMNGQLKSASAKMAAVQLMAALAPEDEVALAGFDSRYFGVVRFTPDRKAVEAGFSELAPFGATALHDALDHAAADIASHGEGRRAVVVITDGVDTASQKAADEVVERSRALDVPIYTVSVVSPLDDPRSSLFTGAERPSAAAEGAKVLARYAALSGGAAFTVSDFKALKLAAERIAAELKTQYRLGYDPPDSPPRFRKIEVRSTRKGVSVRTRSGYLPPS